MEIYCDRIGSRDGCLAQQNTRAKEIRVELEESVTTHAADEDKVSIRGNQAEMIILKGLAS